MSYTGIPNKSSNSESLSSKKLLIVILTILESKAVAESKISDTTLISNEIL